MVIKLGATPPTVAVLLLKLALQTLAVAAAVAGNTALTSPELAAFVVVAPATVKKFAVTPVKV